MKDPQLPINAVQKQISTVGNERVPIHKLCNAPLIPLASFKIELFSYKVLCEVPVQKFSHNSNGKFLIILIASLHFRTVNDMFEKIPCGENIGPVGFTLNVLEVKKHL